MNAVHAHASPRQPRRRAARTRGFAVVIALVAVATASLLGLSLAASRDANAAAGANLAEASRGRLANASAIDIAGTMLADPEILADDATLFAGLDVCGQKVRVDVVDLETGRPAAAQAQAIELVATSRGMRGERVARAVGRSSLARTRDEADLDGSEFAVLATGRVSIEHDALVGHWPAAPLSALREPIRYGVASGESGRVSVDGGARMHGCVRVARGRFAADRDDADEALAAGVARIPEEIHVPGAPMPDAPAEATATALSIDGLVTRDAATTGDARVPARATATLRGDIALDIGGTLTVERGARVIAEGPTQIVVRGNLVLDGSSVEVAPGGSLAFHVLGDATLKGAFAGGWRSDPAEGCDASGDAAYDGGAGNLVVFVAGDGRMLVVDGSVLKGEIYAPSARVDLQSRSAVYGRVLGGEVAIRSGTAIFYDPALDMRRGWTNPASGVWTDAGTAKASVRAVPKLDNDSLVAFSRAAGVLADGPSRALEKLAIARGKPTPIAFSEEIRGRKAKFTAEEIAELDDGASASHHGFIVIEGGDK
jgi:hypothetical protein